MTARRARAAVVRSIGVVAERGIAPATREADRYVALDRLRESVDRVEWAPLRISGEPRGRPTSPRLPHALVLHLAHVARLASRGDVALAAVAVPVDVRALASFVGADEGDVASALGALQRAGVVHAVHEGSGNGVGRVPEAVSIAAELLGPEPRCAALDWAQLALATAGSPSAWVAAHVLAERLVLDEWTPMPRSALERALGCGVSGVRSALDRLTAAGVVERREQRGGVSAYRFAPAVYRAGTGGRGRGGVPDRALAVAAPTATAPTAVSTPTVSRPTVAAAAVAPALRSDTGVRLTVGGVELDVPPGLRVRVELGADGKPQISLVPVAGPGL